MPMPCRAGVLLVAVLTVAAGGCGGGTSKATKSKAKAEKPIAPAEVDTTMALAIDGGRVTVSPPVGWKREPRSKDYLARYLPGGGKTYPSVTVLGGDPPAGIAEVDEANHAEFVAAVTASLAEQFTNAEGKSTLLKKPAAVELGPHKAAVWTSPGKAKVSGLSQPIERSCSAVVVAGRMYTVEARAPKGKLDDDGRASGRGVAAGIAVATKPEPAAEPPAESAGETPAAEPAAVEPVAAE
jgi:hypothetical protein